MKKTNHKIILTSLLISVIFFTVLIFTIDRINKQSVLAVEKVEAIKEEIPVVEIKKTTLFFVGDMMLTRGVKSSVDKNFNGDYSRLFDNLTILKDADILFGNLEGDVSDTGNNVGSIYSFRMDPNVLPAIKNAGFDIVSFANNHVGDWNMAAFKDTLFRLDEIGILKTGAGQNFDDVVNPTIIEKNGTSFGFLGFSDVGPDWIKATTENPGILLASDPNINEIIKNAKTKSDVLIVSFHFGDEYKLIHNKRQETLAHLAIDNGADMVIGHHPHVMEDIEEYNGKPIVYSLGNFIFDQSFSKDTMRGMLYSATFDGKNLVEMDKKIISLNKNYQPEGIFTDDELREKEEIASSSCAKTSNNYEDMFLLNIGQLVMLPELAYIPKDLREINDFSSTKKGICLIKEARDSFEMLTKKADEDGLRIKASSGFRSYETQKIIFNNAVKSGKSDALISVAKPGYSEHQLGTTIDLTGSSIKYSSAVRSFDKTPEDKWLSENAYLYGFIQSYPKGSNLLTGYKYEPWHYRFVGVENAKLIKEKNITITEFLNNI